MEYQDDFRKIHGKVEVTFTDTENSAEQTADVSGNAAVSYPDQVGAGYIEPTIKAATMDGYTTMDGTYQLLGAGIIMGWWSDVACNDDCEFENPPWLTLHFIARPVFTWTIIGDSKLGQYPVDFKLELFNSNNELVHTMQVNGNNQIKYQHVFEETYFDITSVKITLYKWSHPHTKAKILQFFNRLREDYHTNELKQFEVVEELAVDSDGVSYGINSNACSVTIYNQDRKFDQGYLRELLLSDRKVVPYIGIEKENGKIEYSPLGCYFSDSWEVPQTEQWVKLKCYDRLMKFQRMTYVGFPYQQNVTLYDMAADVLANSGLAEGEYAIDEKLREILVQYAFLGKQSVWDALQEICNAGLCQVYVDRNNRVIITVEKTDKPANGIEITPSNTFKFEKTTNQTDFCNSIEVSYSDINATETETDMVYTNRITIDPQSTRTMIVDYSRTVKDAFLTFTPITAVRLNHFQTSINSAKFELENMTREPVVVTIEITGVLISVASTQTVVIQDKGSIEKYGELMYRHPASDLIQTYARAVEIGDFLLRELNQRTRTIKVEWRGDPKLKLENKFNCTDRFGNRAAYISRYSRFMYDGGLKQEIKAKEVIET